MVRNYDYFSESLEQQNVYLFSQNDVYNKEKNVSISYLKYMSCKLINAT